MSKCRITVVKKDLYADLIARYCDPAAVPCEVFEVGDEFLVDRESFFNLGRANQRLDAMLTHHCNPARRSGRQDIA